VALLGFINVVFVQFNDSISMVINFNVLMVE